MSLSLQRRGVVDECRQGMTFQRGSLAYDRRGRRVGVNQGRFETIGARRGMRIEEAESNLLAGATDFQTGWQSIIGATAVVTPGQADPFGGTGAYRVVTNGGTNITKYQGPSISPAPSGTPYTATVWIRVNTPNIVRVRNTASSPVGIVAVTQSQGWTPVTITVIGDGVTTPRIAFSTETGGEALSLDFTVMWPQLTAKSYATSHTPSTRAAEFLTIPTAGILLPTQGTVSMWVYVDSVAKRKIAGVFPPLFHLARADGVATSMQIVHSDNSDNWLLQTRDDANTLSSATVPDSFTPDGWNHIAIPYDGTTAEFTINGVSRGTVNAPKLPSALNGLTLGLRGSTYANAVFADVHLSSVKRTVADALADYNRGYHVPDQYTTFHHLLDGPDSQRAARSLVI